jgi:ABC-type Fe3+ transport system permease subunit
MVVFRWLRVITTVVLGFVLLAPLVALVLAILLDRGPSGETRVSPHFFPVALWLYDDFAWTCTRNSVIFALVVTAASLVVGVAVAWAGARRRFWGQKGLGKILGSLLVVSPAFMALGHLGLWGDPKPLTWPMSLESGPGRGMSLESWSGLPLWLMWVWTTLPAGIALVSQTASRAVERLEPSWDDAARLAGARQFRAWRQLLWPMVRPAAARAAALVFVFSLVEPGAPLVLGLRRTLAFQLIDASRRPEPFPRLAVWAAAAGLIALVGSVLIRRWGGPAILGASPQRSGPVPPRAARAVPAVLSGLLLGTCGIACWLPLVGLARLSFRDGPHDDPSMGSFRGTVENLAHCLRDPPVPELVANSLRFGLELALGLFVLAWIVGAGRNRPSAVSTGPRRTPPVLLIARSVPPLVLGAGAFSLSWLAGLAARSLTDNQCWPPLVGACEKFAALSDPDRNSWVLMTFSVGLVLVPWFLRACQGERRGDRLNARLDFSIEAALLAGESRGRARRLSDPGWWRRSLGRFVLVWALAATNLTPALLFGRWTDERTVAPGVVTLAAGHPEDRCQAAVLALGAIGVLVSALGVARATSAVAGVDEID